MSATALDPPEIGGWFVQTLRFTAFPLTPAIQLQQSWWRDIAGDDSEVVSKKSERAEIGRFEDITLALTMDLLRLQWSVSAPPPIEIDSFEGLQTIGKFVDRKVWFQKLVNQWLTNCPPISRLAFGGVLVIPVDTREQGYELLDRFLRVTEVDPSSTDFLYRVNRPLASRVNPTLRINRLSTWVVGKWMVEIRALQPGQVGTGLGGQAICTERFACTLEFDINTEPKLPVEELSRESLTALFEELASHAQNLARHGDVRQ